MSDFETARKRLEDEWPVAGYGMAEVRADIRLLLTEVDRLKADLDRPRHETLRQLADVIERYDAMKLRAEKAEAELAAERERSDLPLGHRFEANLMDTDVCCFAGPKDTVICGQPEAAHRREQPDLLLGHAFWKGPSEYDFCRVDLPPARRHGNRVCGQPEAAHRRKLRPLEEITYQTWEAVHTPGSLSREAIFAALREAADSARQEERGQPCVRCGKIRQ